MLCPKFTKVYLTGNGLQVPCRFRSQRAAESLVWEGPSSSGDDFSCPGTTEGVIERHVMPDHVHMCLEIPPKHPVASVIGFFKGKSSIAIARQLCGKERNFSGEHFWARGYAVSTVGFELEQVRE
jgi:transposase IS200 family protein